MRIGSFAFAAALVVSAVPALAGWQNREGGSAADGGTFVVAENRNNGESVVGVVCRQGSLSVWIEPKGFASMEQIFDFHYRFDGGKPVEAAWNVDYLTQLTMEDSPGQKDGEARAFAEGLVRHSTLTLDIFAVDPISFSLKGSSGPIHKVLAACE